jgi:hypothetical protein
MAAATTPISPNATIVVQIDGVLLAGFDTGAAPQAFLRVESNLNTGRLRFRVVTEAAAKRTTLKENNTAYARPIGKTVSFHVRDQR